MIGFGSIGRGVLPLLERHIGFDREKFVVISPDDSCRYLVEERGFKFMTCALTATNYEEILNLHLDSTLGQGLIVNVSVDVSSLDMIAFARSKNCFYIDTVIEPWPGFYTDFNRSIADRSNYALRETLLEYRRKNSGGITAVSCCGANPGTVSWFTKQALLNMAVDGYLPKGEQLLKTPNTRDEWARLMHKTGIKGIHIAERDTQYTTHPKDIGTFVNTWSVEGFISEGMQPAELGWGSHERELPMNGRVHDFGCGSAIYLLRPGAQTYVRSWTPTAGPQHGFLVTHNESISIADYFTLREGEQVIYRPTCHYAYHPCNDAVLSLHEMRGAQWVMPKKQHILEVDEIASGIDELGVLLYGASGGAYWYGSQLSIEETRRVAPYQNATGLQVTSAVLAGIIWMLENPNKGIVETDEMDFARCLEIQRPYLGPVVGVYTDWTPLVGRSTLFPEDVDWDDPWQFKNIYVH
jgi:homospermidine synthase